VLDDGKSNLNVNCKLACISKFPISADTKQLRKRKCGTTDSTIHS